MRKLPTHTHGSEGCIISINAVSDNGSHEAMPPVSALSLTFTGQASGQNASRYASKENMTRDLPLRKEVEPETLKYTLADVMTEAIIDSRLG